MGKAGLIPAGGRIIFLFPRCDPGLHRRALVFLSPGLRLSLPGGLAAYSYLQFPAYQKVDGLQLSSQYNLYSGVQVQL